MQHRLDEVLSRAEAKAAAGVEKAAKVEQQGCHRGREESVEFFRKVLVTLAQAFRMEGYFEACLQYVEER